MRRCVVAAKSRMGQRVIALGQVMVAESEAGVILRIDLNEPSVEKWSGGVIHYFIIAIVTFLSKRKSLTSVFRPFSSNGWCVRWFLAFVLYIYILQKHTSYRNTGNIRNNQATHFDHESGFHLARIISRCAETMIAPHNRGICPLQVHGPN